MNRTAIATFLRALGISLPGLVLCATQAAAQFGGPPPQSIPGGRSPVCLRLEGQLALIDRGGAADPAKADQVKRYEDAAGKQQADLDRLSQQSQRLGCRGGGFFALFGGQSRECGDLNNQIQQVRSNLDRTLVEIQRLQGNSGEREGQRRSVLVALGQNDCGPQYRQYANTGPGGFFENLFGGNNIATSPDAAPSGTYRTLCVRSCDGYYFPISYSTVPGKFAEDEQICRRMCPATEVALYSHRNPGEDVSSAVSGTGRRYADMPNAFSYRKQFNAACSCRAPGQSWADALRQNEDQTLERGDIVVTEERARLLSQPRFDAQGKPVPAPKSANSANAKSNPGVSGAPLPPAGAATPAAAPPAEETPEEDRSKRKVRAVGPTFYPVR
jgi:uncharacterized protein DUF2865